MAAAEIEALAKLEESVDWDEGGAGDRFNEGASRSMLFLDATVRTRAGDPAFVDGYIPYSSEWIDAEFLLGIELRGPIDFGIDLLNEQIDPDEATAVEIGRLVESAVERALGDSEYLGDLRALDLNPWWRIAHTESGAAVAIARRQLDGDEARRIRSVAERAASEAANGIQHLARQALERIFFEPPNVALEILPEFLRFSRRSASWAFGRSSRSNEIVGYKALSRAERAWVRRAVAEAIYWQRRSLAGDPTGRLRPLLWLIDEPESSLHRAAEAKTARALIELSRDPRRVIIAATHSPELLDSHHARVLEVRRNALGERSAVSELKSADRSALDQLGLRPSDLLHWPKVLLLVEGEHDEVVLNAYLGDRLRAARVKILPLRGASKLPNTVDSRLLFELTEARLVALLDNQRASDLGTLWGAAISIRDTTSVQAAVDYVVSDFRRRDDDSEEGRYLREWMTAALARGVHDRLAPYGLIRRDIIEYVSVAELVPGAIDWDSLREEHYKAVVARIGAPKDFKKWLEFRYQARIDRESLETAANHHPLPEEFEQLGTYLESAASEDFWNSAEPNPGYSSQ